MRTLTIIFIAVLLSSATPACAQTEIGQKTSDAVIGPLLNTKQQQVSLSQLKGKVVLLEFWATWCGPCVAAQPHLQELQKEYPDQLQIIAISTEKKKRIKQFLINRPSTLWFGIDSADLLRKEFPYHTIPHSVLINGRGEVVAIASPDKITREIIRKVIDGEKIELERKKDLMVDDPWMTYFFADSTTQTRFSMQPAIEGLGSASRSYPKGIFKGRRLTVLNLPLKQIYQIAYGEFPSTRVVDENKYDSKKTYCLDIIVAPGQDLKENLRGELKKSFDFKVEVETRKIPVYTLIVSDPKKIASLPPSNKNEPEVSASHGAFSGEGVTLFVIGNYLEGFGLVNRPVVDETHDSKRYDISFNYQPEKKGDLAATLEAIGLQWVAADRDVEMLVFK